MKGPVSNHFDLDGYKFINSMGSGGFPLSGAKQNFGVFKNEDGG